jgi:hypothetical protein
MHQHDWELLDRQMSHLQPTPRGLDALAFVGLFLAGMTGCLPPRGRRTASANGF